MKTLPGTLHQVCLCVAMLFAIAEPAAAEGPCGAALEKCAGCKVAGPNGWMVKVFAHGAGLAEFQISRPVRNPDDGLFYNRTRWVAQCADGHMISVCEQIHSGSTPELVMRRVFESGSNRLHPDAFAKGQCH